MEKKNNRLTPTILMVRGIIALYLIYLSHQFITDLNDAENPKMLIAFAILFTFSGVLIIIHTIKAFINKEYYDPNSTDEDQTIDDTVTGDDNNE